MIPQNYLEDFIKECFESKPETPKEKFIGWEEIIFTLVGFGLKLILPELKEWVKLGTSVIVVKRLEIKKKLIEYAAKKELDFPAAEKASEVISDKINEENIYSLINALENND